MRCNVELAYANQRPREVRELDGRQVGMPLQNVEEALREVHGILTVDIVPAIVPLERPPRMQPCALAIIRVGKAG